MADVVIAPVAVDRTDHGRAEPGEPYPRERKRAGRKIERQLGVEMPRATPDQPKQRADDASPKEQRDFSNGGDATVKQNHQENYKTARDCFCLPSRKRMQV